VVAQAASGVPGGAPLVDVNIRLTRFNKIGRLYRTILAAQVIRACDLARRDGGATPSTSAVLPTLAD
jgi:hypothetical protein